MDGWMDGCINGEREREMHCIDPNKQDVEQMRKNMSQSENTQKYDALTELIPRTTYTAVGLILLIIPYLLYSIFINS
jgi:hypothetical protein